MSTPYEEGREAFKRQQWMLSQRVMAGPEYNPYQVYTEEWHSWEVGFHAAYAEAIYTAYEESNRHPDDLSQYT